MKRIRARSNNAVSRAARGVANSFNSMVSGMFSGRSGSGQAGGRTRVPVKNRFNVGIPVRRGGK